MILYKVIEQTFKTNNFRYERDIGNLGFEIMQLPIFSILLKSEMLCFSFNLYPALF